MRETWSEERIRDLTLGDGRAWQHALDLIDRGCQGVRRRSSLAEGDLDEIRGNVLLYLLARDSVKLRTQRAPAAFPTFVARIVRDATFRILKRPNSSRPILECDLFSNGGRLTLDCLSRPPESDPWAGGSTAHGGGAREGALSGLTSLQRRVVTLRVDFQLAWSRIAALLHRTESGVRRLFDRAIASLRQRCVEGWSAQGQLQR